jgi:hypothetical protein
MPEGNLLATLRTLRENQVEFILVGGLAAVLNGAPIQTYDVDLVYSREPVNIERLLAVLASMDAIFRIQPERRLRPMASHLAASGHLNLLTRYGPLDLLATIGRGLAYGDLLSHSTGMDIGEGLLIPVLDLETLIAIKEQVGGEKDTAMLPILRQTLNEIRKRTR